MFQKSRLMLALLIVYLAVAGGAIGVMAKLAMPAFTPVAMVFFRVAISLAVFAALLAAHGKLRATCGVIARRRKTFAALGALGVIAAEVVGFWGLERTTAIHYDLIFNMSALAIVASAAWLLRERVSRRDVVLLAAALLGAAIVVTNGRLMDGFSGATLAGDGLVFMAALGWGLYSTMGPRLAKDVPAIDLLGVTFGSFLAGVVMLLPFVLSEPSFGITPAAVTTKTVTALVLLAVVGTALLFPLWFFFVKNFGGVWGALVSLSENIGGVVFPMLFLGERLTVATAIGGALIVAAIMAKELVPATPKQGS